MCCQSTHLMLTFLSHLCFLMPVSQNLDWRHFYFVQRKDIVHTKRNIFTFSNIKMCLFCLTSVAHLIMSLAGFFFLVNGLTLNALNAPWNYTPSHAMNTPVLPISSELKQQLRRQMNALSLEILHLNNQDGWVVKVLVFRFCTPGSRIAILKPENEVKIYGKL